MSFPEIVGIKNEIEYKFGKKIKKKKKKKKKKIYTKNSVQKRYGYIFASFSEI